MKFEHLLAQIVPSVFTTQLQLKCLHESKHQTVSLCCSSRKRHKLTHHLSVGRLKTHFNKPGPVQKSIFRKEMVNLHAFLISFCYQHMQAIICFRFDVVVY